MKRYFIFRGAGEEVILPVTPESYTMEKGANIEIVNIHELGDVSLAGYGTLATIKIDCLFPANDHAFSMDSDPERYVRLFRRFAEEREELRFVVSDTNVNVPVYLQSFQYGERDGTNDIYATITLRERKPLEAVRLVKAPQETRPRASEPQEAAGEISYRVIYGDTLCSICRKFYGNDKPDTYYRLAQYNGRANPNILYAGETLKIPKPLPNLKKQTQPNGGKGTAKPPDIPRPPGATLLSAGAGRAELLPY